MDIVEKKFRDTPKGHKKYVKRLSDYINSLLGKGRVLEAKFHFSELLDVKSKHLKTHVLGYELAIKTFDNEAVLKFDKLLVDQKYKEESLLNLRLQYYYSVNNSKCFGDVASYMLTNITLSKNSLNLIAPLVLRQNNYQAVAALCNYLKKDNKSLNRAAEQEIRKVVFQKLADTLLEIAK